MMPRIDGVGVVTHLAQYRPELVGRVVITTAWGEGALEKVSPPIYRFLEKPFDIERLLREVNECCEEVEN
jgi:DNA-binding NtrC family response regulator